MHFVVGLDSEHLFQRGLDVCLSLQFEDPRATLVHAIEPVLPDSSWDSLSMPNAIGEILRMRQTAGQELLDHVSASLPFPSDSVLDVGGAAGVITQTASRVGGDLIVVGSQQKGTWGSLFFGSVTKGVVIDSESSVLVGKQEVTSPDGLTVVVATDQSDYMNRCIDKLISFQPKGIKRLVLVSAIPSMPNFLDSLSPESAEHAAEMPNVVQSHVEKQAKSVADKLRGIAATVESRVEHGHPNQVIREVVTDVNADLAIIGARGHGFLQRTILGSVSTHQVVSEAYNVLVLRV